MSIQIPVSVVWGSGSRYYTERHFRGLLEEEKRVMRDAFQQYVSPQMLDELTESGFLTPLGGEAREVAVMFTDIANFTDICEQVGDPEKVVQAYLDGNLQTGSNICDH